MTVTPDPAPDPATDPVLAVDDLRMRFGGLTAVAGVSFRADRHRVTALIGPNGAGKTTVFNCVTGFYRPTGGTIRLHAAPTGDVPGRVHALHRLSGHRIARDARVGRTFQNIRLFAGMTVLENLLVAQHHRLMPTIAHGLAAAIGLGRPAAREREAIDRARLWLAATDLLPRADDPAGALPYGAQRRLEIARAMCAAPELLCLDEPAAGLNDRETDALADLIARIRDGLIADPTSILLIEHDMTLVMRVSDRVVVLDGGRRIADGPPHAVAADPAVIAAYLGEPDGPPEVEKPPVGEGMPA